MSLHADITGMSSPRIPLLRRYGYRLSGLDKASLRRSLRVLFPIQLSSKKVALGVAIGVLVAFSPTIGFQMGLAMVIATILNASRLAAVSCVWITNPLTMGPVFAFTYQVGHPFWFSSPEVSISQMSQMISAGHSPYSIGAVFYGLQNMLGSGVGGVMPLLLGGLIIGSVAACLSYPLAWVAASSYLRSRRRRLRPSHRKRVDRRTVGQVDPVGCAISRSAKAVSDEARRRAA